MCTSSPKLARLSHPADRTNTLTRCLVRHASRQKLVKTLVGPDEEDLTDARGHLFEIFALLLWLVHDCGHSPFDVMQKCTCEPLQIHLAKPPKHASHAQGD